ncbi:MAG: hypothetical protein R3F50_11425 [Gammaproteobacteria bacterium]
MANFSILNNQRELTVSGPAGAGTDRLIDNERLHFDDTSLAFDLDGNAGIIAKVLGVVLGKDDWYNKEYLSIGLNIIDNIAIDNATLMQAAFDVILGVNPSNTEEVNLIYVSLVGQTPSQQDLSALTADLLDNGAFTQGSLGELVMDHKLNLTKMDFVGLTQNGLEYTALG